MTTLNRALPITAALINLVPLTTGLYGIINPTWALSALNLTGKFPTNTRVSLALVRMYAVRQFTSGLTNVILYSKGYYEAMGWWMVVSIAIAAVDGWAMRDVVDDAEGWKHWFAMPIGLGLGGALVWRG